VARQPTIRLLIILGMTAAVAVRAQSGNPYDGDARATAAGEALYANRCADCHGADAKGSTGPDLTVLWLSGTTDERIFDSVRRGIPDTVMPPSTAPDEELWAIAAYLKSLSTVPAFVSATGDSNRGRELFSSSCEGCHLVHGVGGSLGPELSSIAEIRSREALVTAIRAPSELVARDYRSVTLVAKDGREVEGIRKAEDAFSIQILDSDERLRSFMKSDLEKVMQTTGSLMPEFDADSLNERELEDLLAYLSTLRRPVPETPEGSP
jgi:putative heme-binding domain-containing protein